MGEERDDENFIRLVFLDGSFVDLPRNKTAKLVEGREALIIYKADPIAIEERRKKLAAQLAHLFS